MIRRVQQTEAAFAQCHLRAITLFSIITGLSSSGAITLFSIITGLSSSGANVSEEVARWDNAVSVLPRDVRQVLTTTNRSIISPQPIPGGLDSTENFTVRLSRCLSNHGRINVSVTSARLVISSWKTSNDVTNSSLFCTLNVVTARDKALYVTHTGGGAQCSWKNRYVIHRIVEAPLHGFDCSPEAAAFTSGINTLSIDVTISKPPGKSIITVKPLSKALETGNVTANLGYIQSPGYDTLKSYPPNADSWVQISVPSDHVTLISFRYIRTFAPRPNPSCFGSTDRVRLYKGSNLGKALLWEACQLYVPLPDVYDASVLNVRFTSAIYKVFFVLRFRLLYSFHQKADQPLRVTEGRWNCSVPEWRKFRDHFRCNLDTECEAGEDEAVCTYAGHCGPGRLTLNGRCYSYHSANWTLMTWRNSNQECQRLGGYLVSLNTPGEWRTVVATLKKRRYPADVYVGLHEAHSVLPLMYRRINMWADKSMAYFNRALTWMPGRCAVFLEDRYAKLIQRACCDSSQGLSFVDSLCESDELDEPARDAVGVRASFPVVGRSSIHVPTPRNASLAAAISPVTCPAGHVTHAFLACDAESECWLDRVRRRVGGGGGGYGGESEAWGVPSRASCPAPMTPLPAMFACGSASQHVPYSVVCDHRRQCADGSDENFCDFPPCSGSAPLQCVASRQCVATSSLCNGQEDCQRKSDEVQCVFYLDSEVKTLPPPAVVSFTPLSLNDLFQAPLTFAPVLPASDRLAATSPSPCPETHFQCPDNGYCLPVFVRCNSVNDCPGREDEAGCDSVSCPGLYRCRSSSVCLHPSHLCDGKHQCPQHDDELFCRLDCPTSCTCHGLNFLCRRPFPAELHPEVRYLDASGSGLTLPHLKENTFLIHLSLSGCGLETLHNATFPNLQSLDLGHNKLHAVSADHLRGMLNLKSISLSGNPLKTLFSSDAENRSFPALRTLDVSGVRIPRLKAHTFSLFPNLQTLNLSQCDVRHVDSEGFHATSELYVLDIVGCPMIQFPRDLLSGLDRLQAVQADNFKLCCPVILPPGFNLENCRAPSDEVSSCDSLLRSDVYRIFLSIFSSLASLGNLGCFLLRSFVLKSSASGFGVFVHHLTISDFLMGVYMAVIGVADRLYLGSYLWEDVSWRHSAACRAAGFLSLMSSEVSALVICLITLDRFLVLRFPFNGSLHFKARSAHVTCALVWVAVAVMAVFPLTPATSHWSFYSQTGICIPLPVTRRDFAGQYYAFGVVIVFNFILFVFIAVGQAAIYVSIQANRMSTADSSKTSSDQRIARRLISVAVSDFLCWFPIGMLGLLASGGVPIPGEASVGVAILVLPLNSALNPFLYTINVLLERRAKRRDERLLKQLMAHVCEEEEKARA